MRIGLLRGVRVRRATLEAEVTIPERIGLALGGACHVNTAGFVSDQPFNTRLSGATSLRDDGRHPRRRRAG